jgi:hypothetical protein
LGSFVKTAVRDVLNAWDPHQNLKVAGSDRPTLITVSVSTDILPGMSASVKPPRRKIHSLKGKKLMDFI